jgi:phosphatidylethanolamine-binding protein (PEBP) family uncharacterized protein
MYCSIFYLWHLIEMKRKNTKRFKKRSKTRRLKRQRGGSIDILVNTGAPHVSIPPPTDLTVKFLPNSKYSASDFGNVLKQHESASEPKTGWTAPPAGTFYTLLCWDPDASQAAGQGGSFLHWLVINCTGTDVSSGKEITDWVPPTPPKGSGQHRYIFGLFQQSGQLSMEPSDNRKDFNIAGFIQQHSLTAIKYKAIRVDS